MSNVTLAYLFSKTFLGSRFMLWSLFWVNLLGTIYGYVWYWRQLVYTAEEMSPWYLPFVPDSPTASLFFTIFVLLLIIDRKNTGEAPKQKVGFWRGVIEAFALITLYKYGIWAVTMIWAGVYQGTDIVWQDWMLTISHLGMTIEGLLYYSFYRFSWKSVILVGFWTLWNDYMDYGIGVFPSLSRVLLDDLGVIELFTISLSLTGIAIAMVYWLLRKISQTTSAISEK